MGNELIKSDYLHEECDINDDEAVSKVQIKRLREMTGENVNDEKNSNLKHVISQLKMLNCQN